jgi:hypothetical protein
MELVHAIEGSLSCLIRNCARQCTTVAGYIIELSRRSLWPLPEMLSIRSLGTLLTQILQVNDFVLPCCAIEHCNHCRQKDFSFRAELHGRREKLLQNKMGLCLDCVKTKQESRRAKQCRIKHE